MKRYRPRERSPRPSTRPGLLVLAASVGGLFHFKVLASNVRKYVERPPFSFADSERAAALDMDINVELQHWLRRAYRDFRELYVRIMLTDLKSSIRL